MNRKASLIAAGIVASLVLFVLIYWLVKRKEPVTATIKEEKPAKPIISADEILRPAYLLVPAADKDFYTILYQSIWKYLAQEFNLSGSEMNKQVLVSKLKGTGKSLPVAELIQVLEHCEAGMFTNASLEENREELLLKVKSLLEQVNPLSP